MSEHDYQTRLLLALGRLTSLRVWRQNSGRIRMPDPRTGEDRWVSLAPPGAADISGILLPHGQRLEIEVKDTAAIAKAWLASKGKTEVAQRAWAAMIRRFGGRYVLVHGDQPIEEATQCILSSTSLM